MIRVVLQSERLGPLPLVNHFIQRMGSRTRSIGTSPPTNAAQFRMLAPWGAAYVDRAGGRFVTVLPRTRLEARNFAGGSKSQINRPGKFTPNCLFNLRKVRIDDRSSPVGEHVRAIGCPIAICFC
jgi:hypothetical protein